MANPNVPLQGVNKGKNVRELFGDKVPVVQKSPEQLLPHKWQYWVDDGVAGKSDGWYDYAMDASRVVDEMFGQWLAYGNKDIKRVKSDTFTYDVDMNGMTQQNTQTGKQRPIRRIVKNV